MTAKHDVLGLLLLAWDVPSDYAALTDAILAFYDQVHRAPRKFSVPYRSGKGKCRAFRAKSFRETMLDEETQSVLVYVDDNIDEHEIRCFLRPRELANQEFELRWVTPTATGLDRADNPVRSLLGSLIELYPIAHGGSPSTPFASVRSKECSWSGSVSGSDLDEATYERLGEDQVLRGPTPAQAPPALIRSRSSARSGGRSCLRCRRSSRRRASTTSATAK